MRKLIIAAITALSLTGVSYAQTTAKAESKGQFLQQTARKPVVGKETLADLANANTVTIISGNVTGSFITIANDISFTLDDGDKLRVLPIIGKGAEQNLYDILLLRGVDIGIVRSDGLEALKADKRIPNAASQISYILKLFSDEAHLMVGKDITDIKQLAGKKVSFDLLGSGANYSGRLVFQRLGIAVDAVNMDNNSAYEKLKTGELAGVFQWASKPINAVAKFEGADKFHLIDIPYDAKLADLYSPATLESKLYPRLLGEGKTVNTLAASSILAVYNWPKDTDRYKKVAKFVDSLYSKIEEFHKPGRHPKWQEVNVNASIPGWKRFPAAQEWLDRNEAPTIAKADLQKFLETRGGVIPQNKDALDKFFAEFQTWQKKQVK